MASTYSTWDYYHNRYRGKLRDADYTPAAIQAAAEIDDQTLGRAATAPAAMAEALQNCECVLVDAIHSLGESQAALPIGIQSINNDGIQVTAASAGNLSRQQLEQEALRNICRKYLTRPVNLMYRGVKR